MVRDAKEGWDDIEWNRIHIKTIANLLHSILQVPKSSSSADSVAAPQTPPAVRDIYDPSVTSKRNVRHALMELPLFQTSKTSRTWRGK